MIYIAIAFFGCILGYFIGRFTNEELKQNSLYLNILEIIILFILSFYFLYSSFNLISFFVGIVFGLLFKFEYFYFGIGIFSSQDFLSSAMIFVYGLPYGSLAYYNKRWKILVYSFILFIIPALTYFFNYNFLSFVGGGLIGIFLLKLWKIFH